MDEEINQLCRNSLQFASDLYQGIKKEKNSNILFSPLCLLVILCVLYAGSKTATNAELRKILHLEDFPRYLDIHDLMHSIIECLENITETGLKFYLATRIFVKLETPIMEEFQKIVQTNYHSNVEPVIFNEETLEALNAWIQNKTDNTIKNALPVSFFKNEEGLMTKMVMVSVVYFKGNWDISFDPKDTKPRDFYLDSTSKVSVDMMCKLGYFANGCIDEMKCQILRMSCAEGNIYMYVILPYANDGLAELESALSGPLLFALINSPDISKVKVTMPKFRMTLSIFLENILPNMGLISLFSQSKADLSGMTEEKELFVSSICHKTFIDVTEKGTEASALVVTGIPIPVRVGPFQPYYKEFTADHPFLVVIQDKNSECILFLGRIMNPLELS